jgi:hypothetical protein
MKSKRLYLSHIKTHHAGKTTSDYKSEFPGSPLSCQKDNMNIAKGFVRYTKSDRGRQISSEKIKGEKNPNSKANATEEERKSRSPFSVSYYIKLGFSAEEAKEKISKFASEMAADRLTTTQLEYWVIKCEGDVELAKELLRKRQNTFSLEKCIERLGEIEGRKRWIQRQEKWITNYRKKSYSFISQELFWKIQEDLKFSPDKVAFATFDAGQKTEAMNVNKEARLFLDTRLVLPDFIHFPSKRIIEFDGVYYHRNTPENKSRENKRDEDLIRNGYKVFHVNERDYRENPQIVIQNCLEFLNEKTSS